jgi:hypothetical protein
MFCCPFAQFEREVIGERIRDKIAASKKKAGDGRGVPFRDAPAGGSASIQLCGEFAAQSYRSSDGWFESAQTHRKWISGGLASPREHATGMPSRDRVRAVRRKRQTSLLRLGLGDVRPKDLGGRLTTSQRLASTIARRPAKR